MVGHTVHSIFLCVRQNIESESCLTISVYLDIVGLLFSQPAAFLCFVFPFATKVAIGESAESGDSILPDYMYLLLYSKGGPHEATFMQIRRHPTIIGAECHAGAWPSGNHTEWLCPCPFAVLHQDEVALADDAEFCVLRNCRFESSLVVCEHAA